MFSSLTSTKLAVNRGLHHALMQGEELSILLVHFSVSETIAKISYCLEHDNTDQNSLSGPISTLFPRIFTLSLVMVSNVSTSKHIARGILRVQLLLTVGNVTDSTSACMYSWHSQRHSEACRHKSGMTCCPSGVC